MFHRIVVPLDGTPFSEAALAPAGTIARAFDARIILMRAVATDDGSGAAIDGADAYLHDVIRRVSSESLVSGLDIYATDPSISIAYAAELEHADLIVMTAHPRWKLDLLDDTSTTLQVLAHSDVPILVWRANEEASQSLDEARGPHWPFLSRTECPIIVPLDGSPGAEAALPMAEALVSRFGSYLMLVCAVADERGSHTSAITAHTDAEHPAIRSPYEYLRRVQHQVQEHGVGVIVAVHRGQPTNVIEQLWREYDASLVVMASRRRTGVSTGLVDSVAARIIEQLTLPVLVVRSDWSSPSGGATMSVDAITRTAVSQQGETASGGASARPVGSHQDR